ncbi:hypothetical protein OAL78_01295 [Candidatus Pelagibacter sp.]|jgi:hypothetical protein|uniref:hypothetical protein n=1 Tax=uncultured Candidatus Pelagibacter sp. TaxID=372654 RepID=UPI00236AF664|nr:hypothetical protein [uncultured Candidatus Pelagibacter sp.]MDB3946716.1 hypothetical protein [Candidatus Pelagibacter sp.]MDC0428155.1 hypothetical protein [Candidatus Pelagibacter sp.]MDC0465641.1 hypothetical protein [Candidatus Pelagibacter sp.]
MDEEISIINSNARHEKVRSFFVNNKNKIISIIVVLIIVIVGAYSFDSYQTNKRKEISNKFNSTTLAHSENTKGTTVKNLVEIIKEQDSTYSPLSLYFIIDNKLVSNQSEINDYFDILIEKTSLDKEIKNLVIYKKALFNSDQAQENDLLNILNPLINSKSVWKSHALYLMAEYFYFKDQKQKSKEFFNQIANLEDANSSIKAEAQKRLKRDLSD